MSPFQTTGASQKSPRPRAPAQGEATWTLSRRLKKAMVQVRSLLAAVSDTAGLDTRILFAHLPDRTIMGLMAADEEELLTEAECRQITDLTRQRLKSKPVAYITGKQDFWKHRFCVSGAVLIPRPETELLVEQALTFLKDRELTSKHPLSFLDVGTGSGCIAISLASELPLAVGQAWDICPAALEIARKNQQRIGTNVFLRLQDALRAESWKQAGRFHLIVSNPPYISSQEADDLPAEVRNWEPKAALYAKEGGLAFYKYLALHTRSALYDKGCIMMETGYRQASLVQGIFEQNHWKQTKVYKDLAGIDRLVIAYR